MIITNEFYPDQTAFDKNSPYYDSKSQITNPKWFSVEVSFLCCYKTPLLLQQIKAIPNFAPNPLVAKFSRLSVIPLTEEQSKLIEDALSNQGS